MMHGKKTRLAAAGALMGVALPVLPLLAQDTMGTMGTTGGTTMTMTRSSVGALEGLSEADQTTIRGALAALPLGQQVQVLRGMYGLSLPQRTQMAQLLAAGGTLVVTPTGGDMIMVRTAGGEMMTMAPGMGGMMAPMPMGAGTMPMGAPMMSAEAMAPQDRVFMVRAAMGNLDEVQMSQLALQRASNPQVRQLAQFLVTEHSRAQADLLPIMRSKGVTPPTPGAASMAIMQRLQRLSGAEFDRQYMAVQVEAHENAIALYMTGQTAGQDPDAKAYIARYLPRIIGHTAMIYNVARAVGAPGMEFRPATPVSQADMAAMGVPSMSEMMNMDAATGGMNMGGGTGTGGMDNGGMGGGGTGGGGTGTGGTTTP